MQKSGRRLIGKRKADLIAKLQKTCETKERLGIRATKYLAKVYRITSIDGFF